MNRRTIGVRALFAAVLLTLPAMIVVRERVGEAYPGLYQPAFDGVRMSGDVLERNEVEVVVRDAAGRDHAVDPADLVDAPHVDDVTEAGMTRSLLRDPAAVRSPAVVASVRQRLVAIGIASPTRLRVTWFATTRSPHDAGSVIRGRTVDSYDVGLGP